MNYIDLNDLETYLNINVNVSVSSGDLFYFEMYRDGSDSVVYTTPLSGLVNLGYYQQLYIDTDGIGLIDETQYNVVGFNESGQKVVYRGKFQTTSKDILDYSINENKYTQKINSTNYTILD